MRYARRICAALTALAVLSACGTPEQSSIAQPTAAPAALAATAAPTSLPTSAAPPATAAPSDTPTRGPVPEPPPKCGPAATAQPGQPQPTPALCPTATPDLATTAAPSSGIIGVSGTTGPITAQPTAAEEFDPSGARLADPAQKLDLQVGATFRLKLGDGMDWTVTIGDQQIVARAPGATSSDPAGPYQALMPGATTILAIGNPTCLKSQPACMRPSIAYQIQVTVR